MADSTLLRALVAGAVLVVGLGGLIALSLTSPEDAPAAAPPSPAAATPAPAPLPTTGVLAGLCEASAIVPWGGGYLVGDNETEGALHRFGPDLAATGPLPLGAVVEDIEALAVLPDGGLLVVGSQGANKNGKRKPNREQVLVLGAAPVTPDLSGCPECGPARALPPKEGGLSIEGAAYWGAHLWLGVRSPLRDGKALLLRMEGDPRVALSVAEVVPVDLGGLGVRDLVPDGVGMLVLAGPTGGGDGAHRLYRLDVPTAPPKLVRDGLPSSAEGLLVEPGGLLVVTDGDGKPGAPCAAPATWARLATGG
jgi:hypothetical protein